MRRWNGWGEETTHYPLKKSALTFLQQRLGAASALADSSLDEALAAVPASRLPEHPLISTDPELRLRHARGQSLPDWLAMRSGNFGRFPDGVAQPSESQQVRVLLDWAREQGVLVIPYGGGTSVAGHINPPGSDAPVLTLSLAKMDQLLSVDRESQIATFGAGTPGPKVEAQLAAHGFTLGHFPQSWELSTLGGWIASRSSGQQSMRYGRIEQLFAGGNLETFAGTLTIPPIPASSAGPDLREMVMGSEGRFGVLTEVKMRVSPQPTSESFHVAFAPDWDSAVNLVREITQARLPLSMLRLSNPEETRTHLTLAGHPRLIGGLELYLSVRGCGQEKCMITYGVSGDRQHSQYLLKRMRSYLRQASAVPMGTLLGNKWRESRFRSPYLRHGLWEHGYAVDTLETCMPWSQVSETMTNVEQAIHTQCADGEKAHVFTHLSHLYPQGCSLYTTYVFRCAESYAATEQRWAAMKSAASDAIVAMGGTISHQHGVGRDHAPWLQHEKGEQGMAALHTLARHFDPHQQLNPGCLLEDP